MAYKGFGAWALIAQYFTNTIVDIPCIVNYCSMASEFVFSWKSAKKHDELWLENTYGGFIREPFDQLRSLIVEKAYTSADLAFYNKGNQLPSLITNMKMYLSIMSEFFPAIANVSDEKHELKK